MFEPEKNGCMRCGLASFDLVQLRGEARSMRWSIRASGYWYDFTVSCAALGWSRQFAGRVETGRDGVSDPALGRPAR